MSKEENRYGMRYNDYEDKKILMMHSSGADCAEIAAALGHGRTANSVNLRLKKLLGNHKKPSSNIPDKEAIRIAELHFDGKRSSEIVQMTGWSDRTVARITRLADAIVQLIIVRLIRKRNGGTSK